MNNIAFIPARAGSKGIPGKNIKLLAGKPLILYTVDAAIQSQVDKVVLSSDGEEIHSLVNEYVIKNYSQKRSKMIYHVRPKGLAGDNSAIIEAVDHYFSENKTANFGVLVLLQPTSPLRGAVHINHFLQKMQNEKVSSMVSVCEVSQHPSEMIKLEDGKLRFLLTNPDGMQRQQYSVFYYINGAMYGVELASLRKDKRFIREDSGVFIMEESASVDIDTPFDLLVAEQLLLSQVL